MDTRIELRARLTVSYTLSVTVGLHNSLRAGRGGAGQGNNFNNCVTKDYDTCNVFIVFVRYREQRSSWPSNGCYQR